MKFLKNLKKNNVIKTALVSLLLIGCIFTMFPQDADAANLGYTDVGHDWETPSTCSTCGGDHLVSGTCYTSGCSTCGGDGVYYKCNYCSSTAQSATSHRCSGQGNNTVGYIRATHKRANYANCSGCYASGTYKGKNTRCRRSGCAYNYYAAHSIYPGGVCYQTPNKIKLTLDANGGSGGTSAVWYYYNTATYYSNEACTTKITAITRPTKRGHTFLHYAGDGTSGGTNGERYIAYDGIEFASDLHYDIYQNATLYAGWAPKTIQLTLDKNGGSGGTNYVYYKYGTSTFYSDAACTTQIAAITKPTRAGYVFTGYVGDGTQGGYADEKYIAYNGIEFASDLATDIYNNATLKATWELETYTVTYHNNGGSGAPSAQSFYMNGIGVGTTTLSAKVPTRTGYTFTGWYCRETGTTLQPGQAIPDYWGTMNLDAQWSPNTYTITYHGNGGLYNGANTWSENVTYNTSYTIWSNDNFFVREGYSFTGWNESPNGNGVSWTEWIGKPWTWTYAKDTTIYAQWSRKQYTVTYDANGGKLDGSATAKVYYGDDVDLSPTATKDGRIFLGWAESPDASTCLTNKKMLASDITLYARYSLPISDVKEATLYAVDDSGKSNKFPMDLEGQDVNGYIYSKLNTNLLTGLSYSDASREVSVFIEIYDHAGNQTIIPVIGPEPPPLPVKYLQTVKHWTWNMEIEQWTYLTTTDELVLEGETFTPSYLPEDDPQYPQGYYNYQIDASYTVTQEKEVNAYYKPIAYKLYFDPNGGSCDVEYKTVYNGDYIGELPSATRKGHDFLGWFTGKEDGTRVVDTDKFTGHEDMTVYAHWEIHTNKVIYDYKTNLGQSADFTEAEVEYGANVDLTNKAYKDGWVFVGWNTDPDATTGLKSYKMPDGNLYLYAIYKKDIVATFIDKNDEEVVTRKTNNTIYNKTLSVDVKVLEQNEMTGWKCLGWSKQTTGKADIEASSGATINITDSITLYGCYVREIKVSYDTNGSAAMIPDDVKEQFFNAAGNYTNPQFTLADAPELEKHSFVKWEVSEGKEVGKKYNAGQKVEFDQDTVLKAVWDQFPEIEAYDRYFTLEEAQNGEITPERLFEKVTATDREDGLLDNGTDVTIPGYTPDEFKSFTDDGSVTVTYKATDSFGNEVTKTVTVYIVDTNDIGALFKTYVRFIDKDYYKKADSTYVEKENGGLEEHSKWKTDEEYAAALESVLSYEKINILTNNVTVLGNEEVVPDLSTGEWVNKKQTWTLNKNTIEAVEDFVDAEGYAKYLNENAIDKFYELFESNNVENEDWNPYEFRVFYNANGGSGEMEKSIFRFDVEGALRLNKFTRTGHTFAGWNTKEDGSGVSYADGQTIKNITDESMITLYAQWIPHTYTVYYNANGGTGTTAPSNHTYDVAKALTPNGFTKAEYVFKGWNTKADGTGFSYNDGAVLKNLTLEDTFTLYAQWTQKQEQLTIKHTLNGQAVSEADASKLGTFDVYLNGELDMNDVSTYDEALIYGTSYEIKDIKAKDGYSYIGDSSYTGVIRESAKTVTLNWTLKDYTLTFDGNGGTPTETTRTLKSGAAYGELPTAERVGYIFIGWNLKANGGGEAVTAETLMNSYDTTIYAQWTVNQYTATFEANGGTTANPQSIKKDYNTELGTLPETSRTGYTFKGWYTAKTGGTKITETTKMGASNVTYYAQWTVNQYTATFDGNGGTTANPQSIKKDYNEALGTLPTASRTDYTFVSWNTKADGSGTTVTASTKMPAGNVTYYAQWTINSYTLTFDGNGGSSSEASRKVTYNSAYGELPTASRTGYTFNGWNTKADGSGTTVTASTKMGADNVTVYAQWTPLTYTIKYDANGGSGSMSSHTVSYDGSATIKGNAFTAPTGYSFAGWTTKSNGTDDSYGWTGWSGKWKYVNGQYGITNNTLTLYARWTINSYTATFDANGGTTANPSSITKNYNAELGTLPTTSRTGYTFKGWYTAKTGGTKITETTKMGASNVTYYAQWTANKIKLTLNTNGGSGGTTTVWYYFDTNKYYSNEACTKQITSITKPSRTGHTYAQYYGDGSSGGNNPEQYIYADGSFAADLCTDIYKDATLYAKWTANTYTISYNANGGSGAPSSHSYTYASSGSTNLSSKTPTRSGYTFLGWSLDSAASSASYSAGQAWWLGNASNYTLYAVWSGPNTITINYYSNYADYMANDLGYGTGVSSGSNKLILSQTLGYFDSYPDGLPNIQNRDYLYLSRSGYQSTHYWGTSTNGGHLLHVDTAGTGAQIASALGVDISNGSKTVNVYAQWTNIVKITLDRQWGSGGPDAIYFRINTNKYYLDAACTNQVTRITTPTRSGYSFQNYYYQWDSSTSERYIYQDGTFASDLCTDIQWNATLYARWQ